MLRWGPLQSSSLTWFLDVSVRIPSECSDMFTSAFHLHLLPFPFKTGVILRLNRGMGAETKPTINKRLLRPGLHRSEEGKSTSGGSFCEASALL